MDRDSHWSIVEQRISQAFGAALPYGEGRVSGTLLRHLLTQVGQVGFSEGQAYALLNILTAQDVADQLRLTAQRVRVLARTRHVGEQIQRGVWLFRPDDVERLRPGKPGRRPKA